MLGERRPVTSSMDTTRAANALAADGAIPLIIAAGRRKPVMTDVIPYAKNMMCCNDFRISSDGPEAHRPRSSGGTSVFGDRAAGMVESTPHSADPKVRTVTISHDVQDATLDQLVEWATALIVPGERRILGLTGAPGAGKSTVADRLVTALGPELAVLVPMDGFHLANDILIDMGRLDRKGAHDTFDDGGYARLIATLRAQRIDDPTVYAPRFRREIEESIGSSIPVPATVPLVVTEGNYLLLEIDSWPVARSCIDEVWFLAPDDDIRHARLVRRHESHGKTPEDAAFWAFGSDERNAQLIESTAGRADRIVRLR